jgi:hypothetical protein
VSAHVTLTPGIGVPFEVARVAVAARDLPVVALDGTSSLKLKMFRFGVEGLTKIPVLVVVVETVVLD